MYLTNDYKQQMDAARTITSPQTDDEYQEHILQGVSRTFALTIPQLPSPLYQVVSNAYLLCRIADTIEDDKNIPHDVKRQFANQFISVVAGRTPANEFSDAFYPQLLKSATADEKDLIFHTPAVIRITHSFNHRQRAALERCIRIMADGMAKYQENDVSRGLADMKDMDNYCYYVAGVVGEMLTELFCDYSNEIDRHHYKLMKLARSFGQGLQMTNILKDIWDDQARNMCWLPTDIFQQYGADLNNLSRENSDQAFSCALGHLIGIARSHLENALQYTLLIPKDETGIRRFCLWAIGMAVLTLKKINKHRHFGSSPEVKISRRSVKTTILVTNLLTRQDTLLMALFKITAFNLPVQVLSSEFNRSANQP